MVIAASRCVVVKACKHLWLLFAVPCKSLSALIATDTTCYAIINGTFYILICSHFRSGILRLANLEYVAVVLLSIGLNIK